MHGRSVRIALLAYQALWLCVIVPGHTRGIVVLPGTSRDAACCHAPGKSTPCNSDAPKRQQNCAICAFAARLSPAIAIDLTPPPLELLRREVPPFAHIAPTVAIVLTCHERAPPLA
jgi:hypothetical protein